MMMIYFLQTDALKKNLEKKNKCFGALCSNNTNGVLWAKARRKKRKKDLIPKRKKKKKKKQKKNRASIGSDLFYSCFRPSFGVRSSVRPSVRPSARSFVRSSFVRSSFVRSSFVRSEEFVRFFSAWCSFRVRSFGVRSSVPFRSVRLRFRSEFHSEFVSE